MQKDLTSFGKKLTNFVGSMGQILQSYSDIKPTHRFQIDEPREYFLEKYHEIIDICSAKLKTWISDKALHVLGAVELLLISGWNGNSIEKENIQIVRKHYGYDKLDSRRLEAELISLQSLNENTGITSVH